MFAIFYPMIFIGMCIGFGAGIKKEDQSYAAVENKVVTSPTYDDVTGANLFIDASSGLKTTQDFQACRAAESARIGILYDSKEQNEANTALTTIFTKINEAYSIIDSAGLDPVEFYSMDEVFDYTQDKNYKSNALCFVYGWSNYVNNDNDDDTFDFNLLFMTDLIQDDMTDPNLPQDRYYDASFKKESMTSLYGLIWCTIATISVTFANYGDTLGVGAALLFTYLFMVQTIFRSIILRYLIPKNFVVIVQVIILIFGIAASYALVGDVPSSALVAVGCVLAPMLQINYVFHLAYLQMAFPDAPKLNFSNFTYEVIPGVSLAFILGYAVMMAVIYSLLLLYLWPLKIETDPENPLSWYYPFTCSFWCKKHDSEEEDALNNNRSDTENPLNVPLRPEMKDSQVDLSNIDLQETEKDLVTKGQLELPAQTSLPDAGKLVITDLVKRYGNKTVVDNLSLTIFQHEILVLLGHNGAGKTTTLNMLTGMTKPSSGTAVAYNIQNHPVDLFTDYQNISDFIGLCPQVDVLFTMMTVKENLMFYCKLRNVENMDQVIEETLEKFNLTAKADMFAGQISGGQKRKLQLAIALLGDSKIVLLDEPTSGMDPTARRETWEIIKQAKQNRIIILTTHYMDEAEFLADRVAVVSRGSLKICGTTSFLKQKFGSYFYLEVDPIQKGSGENRDLMTLLSDANQSYRAGANNRGSQEGGVRGIVEERKRTTSLVEADAFEQIECHIDEAGMVVYKMANYMASKFSEIFYEVDNDKSRYGIENYKIRNMTLEQVFIAIGEDETKQDVKDLQAEVNPSTTLMDDLPPMQKPGFGGAFCAMLVATFQSFLGMGLIFICIMIAFFLAINFMAVYSVPAFRSESTLDFNDLDQIWDSTEYQYVVFNQAYSSGDSNDIVASIISNEPKFQSLSKASWDPPSTPPADYTTYFEDLINNVDDLEQSSVSKGAYWVDAAYSGTSDSWDIQAVVYGSMSSPASLQSYGSVLLEQIARKLTNEDLINLKFEYRAFDQTVGTQVSAYYFYGIPLISVGGLFVFALEMFLTIMTFSHLQSGYFSSITMRGATKASYVLAKFCIEFWLFFYLFLCYWAINALFGIDTSGWFVLGLLFCVAETLLQATFYSLFLDRAGCAILRIVLMASQWLMISFTGAWLPQYTESTSGKSTAEAIVFAFAYSPAFTFLNGVFFTQYRYTQYSLTMQEDGTTSTGEEVDALGKYGAQVPMYMLIGQIGFYGFILLLSLFACRKPVKKEPSVIEPIQDQYKTPEEVKAEHQRVSNLINHDQGKDDVLIVHNLTKKYYTKAPASDDRQEDLNRSVAGLDEDQKEAEEQKNTGYVAVRGTSFGVKRGEVFSLLGVNGAGKSSTFNCIAGEQRCSGGTVLLDGQSIDTFVGNTSKLHGLLGYCPQTNNFDGSLTVKQSLMLYAKLVGISQDLERYVDSTIIRFGLNRFVDTQAFNLSGGNMRKLTLAQAMIGRPKVIYIDEASSGVDPASRRTMWKAIRHEGAQSAVVMTTHAMEEAEAISSKIAIQVSGWFRSFGTLAQVQKEGNQGYFVDFSVDLDAMLSEFYQADSTQETMVRDIESVKHQLRLWEDILRQVGGNDKPLNYVNEFAPMGLLGPFYKRVERCQPVDLKNILRELLMQDTMAGIINQIEQKGMQARVMNYDGAYVVMEVSKCTMTFGQIYAFMESMKLRHNIKEYSCKLSSLEEVFNAHATEQMYKELNERLERRRTTDSFASVQD